MRRKWTQEEIEQLESGVEEFGEGQWAKILLSRDFNDRTSIDLKDKWRNMKKATVSVV